ncbi:MAG: hypothetical protein HY282_03235 [Nitrospirae bacterium]|nr:hypothetical protein [Candidatus Manganitrophaceae bacterium]
MLKEDPIEPLMMVELYRLGCNVSWIAKLIGCKRDRVYRQLRSLLDLPPNARYGRPSVQALPLSEREEIAEMDAAGISPIDIAEILVIDLPTVLGVLEEKMKPRRICLRCGLLSSRWICGRCRRQQARAGVGFDEAYS